MKNVERNILFQNVDLIFWKKNGKPIDVDSISNKKLLIMIR
jgi:hypothetical protein